MNKVLTVIAQLIAWLIVTVFLLATVSGVMFLIGLIAGIAVSYLWVSIVIVTLMFPVLIVELLKEDEVEA